MLRPRFRFPFRESERGSRDSAQHDKPTEPAWPAADVIIGNPPFLGSKRLRSELGNAYVDALFKLYDGRVPREADLVCYWFEKARAMIEAERTQRAGLIATQGIRGGANRKVLERIKQTGDIFYAWSDRDWILNGATVHVSIIAFDIGKESIRRLNDEFVASVNADLTSSIDLALANQLQENVDLSFMGVTPAGKFDVDGTQARKWLTGVSNPNGGPNSEVVRPYFNGIDLTRGVRDVWIVDFGTDMPLDEAA